MQSGPRSDKALPVGLVAAVGGGAPLDYLMSLVSSLKHNIQIDDHRARENVSLPLLRPDGVVRVYTTANVGDCTQPTIVPPPGANARQSPLPLAAAPAPAAAPAVRLRQMQVHLWRGVAPWWAADHDIGGGAWRACVRATVFRQGGQRDCGDCDWIGEMVQGRSNVQCFLQMSREDVALLIFVFDTELGGAVLWSTRAGGAGPRLAAATSGFGSTAPASLRIIFQATTLRCELLMWNCGSQGVAG
ncbi:hypothetical protein SVAN01_07968 [Stagonosporopsis vannaccii]|nr:hypothetical protein SVAN01_07968 [Stagonosporopsis vannaccii]